MLQEAKDELAVLLERAKTEDTRFGAIRKALVLSLDGYVLSEEEAFVLKYYIDQVTEISGR